MWEQQLNHPGHGIRDYLQCAHQKLEKMATHHQKPEEKLAALQCQGVMLLGLEPSTTVGTGYIHMAHVGTAELPLPMSAAPALHPTSPVL